MEGESCLGFVEGVIVAGYGVASGTKETDRFPKGTLAPQIPHFKRHGIDLSHYYLGTLNVSIAPHEYKVLCPKQTVEHLQWHDLYIETFSFMDCVVRVDGTEHTGLVYYPHPETKPEHVQDRSVLELILPWIPNLHTGKKVVVGLDHTQIELN